MSFKLPEIDFLKTENGLKPLFSNETIEFHFGKHHKAYVDNLNKLIVGSDFEKSTLEEIVKKSAGPLFNNAAQAWNHTFFWLSLNPKKEKSESQIINKNFGSHEKFKEEFTAAATSFFGSGWIWLVQEINSDKLKIISTANADCPIKLDYKPLMVCDVWEHAYYIDYRNARAKYVEIFLNSINWDFIDANFNRKSVIDLHTLMKA